MQVNGQLHAPAILPLGKEPRYPSNRRPHGHHSRCGRFIEEIHVFHAQYILFVSCRDKQKGIQCHAIANSKSNLKRNARPPTLCISLTFYVFLYIAAAGRHPSGSDCYNIKEHKPVMQWYNTGGMAWYLWISFYACWYLCVTPPVVSSLVSTFLLAYIRINLIYHTDLFSRRMRRICVRHAIVKRRMDVGATVPKRKFVRAVCSNSLEKKYWSMCNSIFARLIIQFPYWVRSLCTDWKLASVQRTVLWAL